MQRLSSDVRNRLLQKLQQQQAQAAAADSPHHHPSQPPQQPASAALLSLPDATLASVVRSLPWDDKKSLRLASKAALAQVDACSTRLGLGGAAPFKGGLHSRFINVQHLQIQGNRRLPTLDVPGQHVARLVHSGEVWSSVTYLHCGPLPTPVVALLVSALPNLQTCCLERAWTDSMEVGVTCGLPECLLLALMGLQSLQELVLRGNALAYRDVVALRGCPSLKMLRAPLIAPLTIDTGWACSYDAEMVDGQAAAGSYEAHDDSEHSQEQLQKQRSQGGAGQQGTGCSDHVQAEASTPMPSHAQHLHMLQQQRQLALPGSSGADCVTPEAGPAQWGQAQQPVQHVVGGTDAAAAHCLVEAAAADSPAQVVSMRFVEAVSEQHGF